MTLRATPSPTGGGWLLDGHKSFVVDGWVADTLLVAGRTRPTARVALFLVDGDAPGVDHTRLATVDLTRQQTRVELSGTPGRLVGDEGAFERLLDLAATLLAAEQVGGARPVPGDDGGPRPPAGAVRPAHRELPGRPAPVRRHAAGGGVGPVGLGLGHAAAAGRPPAPPTSPGPRPRPR